MKSTMLLSAFLLLSLGAVAQTCSQFPCVVATVSLTNQSEGIPQTTLLTPANSGLFRINTYVSTSGSTDGAAGWIFYFGYVDDRTNRVVDWTFRRSETTFGTPINALVVRVLAGQPLLYSVKPVPNQPLGGLSYDLHIVVEQLQ